MTDEIRSIVHLIVKNSVDSVSEMEYKCERMMKIVQRAANNSCCLCCDSCLSCDAQDLLKEFESGIK